MQKRPTWDQQFMELAVLASKRSTCTRRSVGAIIVRDTRVISTGYNGPPKGAEHCDVSGCIREELNVPSGQRAELCRGIHAEQNAIIQAAVSGVSVVGGTLYCTNHPCSICAKMIINSGISEVVYMEDYVDAVARDLFVESGIRVRRFVPERQSPFSETVGIQ